MAKQTKITKSARWSDCQVRIPNHCNFNNETTVFAHKNGGGIGTKSSNIHGSFSCSNCHDVVDSRVTTEYTNDEILVWFYEGIFRTQQILLDRGLIKI